MTAPTFPARALALLLAIPSVGAGQSLDRQVRLAADGFVQFDFASRPGACGDGATYISSDDGGRHSRIIDTGNDVRFDGRGRYGDRIMAPCIHGPVRVVLSLSSGEPTRIRTYVGPIPPARGTGVLDLGTFGVRDAAAFLSGVAQHAPARPAEQAMLPLLLADTVTTWPTLLQLARDEERPRRVRQQSMFWLSREVATKLGVSDDEDDDDVRSSAVFAISQQPKDQAVPQLITLARSGKHPGVRATALFWLGQSGDPRAVDLFAEMLGAR
jgi:hypothetical protein